MVEARASRRRALEALGCAGAAGIAGCAPRPLPAQPVRDAATVTATAARPAAVQGVSATPGGAPPRGSGMHPNLTVNLDELAAFKVAAPGIPTVSQALQRALQQGSAALSAGVTLPGPGGASSSQQKQNDQLSDRLLQLGLAYALTGDERYAQRCRQLFLAYAQQYPTLRINPAGTTKSRLYWQSLDEAVWMTKLAQAYDFVYESPSLGAEDKATIERDLLRRACEVFLLDDKTVDKTNNWATWACAAVALAGYAMGDQGMVDQALLGTKRDGARGFLWQLDTLFSPEGWYEEGASYAVYALLPFFYVAEAVERREPGRSAYAYRDGILLRSIVALAAASYPSGDYPAVNDSPRPGGNVSGLGWRAEAAYHRAGRSPAAAAQAETLLAIAARSGNRSVNAAGLAVAQALAARPQAPAFAPPPVELSDGPTGGLGTLRLTPPEPQRPAMALMKYGQLGGGHGHYDKLEVLFYAGGQEALTDYGFVRFVGVEAKDGGKYLPENDSYGRMTVGHNTVVVDERRQSEGRHPNEANNASKRWFDTAHDGWQTVSATADTVYPGVAMERTIVLAQPPAGGSAGSTGSVPGGTPAVLLDLYRLRSAAPHRYDYTWHPLGELQEATIALDEPEAAGQPLGPANGYQHLALRRRGTAGDSFQLRWALKEQRYTMTLAPGAAAELIVAELGANDPNDNLRHEPAWLLRVDGAADHTFAAAMECHGGAPQGSAQSVRVFAQTADATGVLVEADGYRARLLVAHGPADAAARHTLAAGGRTFTWTGVVDLQYE